MLRPYTSGDASELHDVGADFDVEPLQQQLAHRPASDASDGLAGAGALQDVARVLAVVLEDAREVGVPRPGPRDLPAARLRGGLGPPGPPRPPAPPGPGPPPPPPGGAPPPAPPHAPPPRAPAPPPPPTRAPPPPP